MVDRVLNKILIKVCQKYFVKSVLKDNLFERFYKSSEKNTLTLLSHANSEPSQISKMNFFCKNS